MVKSTKWLHIVRSLKENIVTDWEKAGMQCDPVIPGLSGKGGGALRLVFSSFCRHENEQILLPKLIYQNISLIDA